MFGTLYTTITAFFFNHWDLFYSLHGYVMQAHKNIEVKTFAKLKSIAENSTCCSDIRQFQQQSLK